MKHFVFRVIFLVSSIGLTSCVTTVLEGPGIGPEYRRLAATGRRPLSYHVSSSTDAETLGHQYVLALIPAGRVRHHDLTSAVEAAIFRVAARHGDKPVRSERSNAVVSVELRSISLTAYDLLFLRRLHGAVEARVRSTRGGAPREFTVIRSSGQWRFFGFKPQLEHTFERLLDDLAESIYIERAS